MDSTALTLLVFVLQVFDSAAQPPGFGNLPTVISIPEDKAPGSVIYTIILYYWNAGSSTLTMSANPSTTFFNPPSIYVAGGNYNSQVSLSSSAVLNSQVVNFYTLTFTFTNNYGSVTDNLYVSISSSPKCSPLFTSPIGDTVEVLETIAGSAVIYTVTTINPGTTAVLSYSFTTPPVLTFQLSNSGNVLVPAAGFVRQNAVRTYVLLITVQNQGNLLCNGILNVKVLPVAIITFAQNVLNAAIVENTGPATSVITVQAQQTSVFYQLIKANSAFQLNERTGEIRTTYNLNLDTNPLLANTQLLIRAYNGNRTASATVTVNIKVTNANDVPPECTPAVVATQIPETTSIGTTLFTLRCQDKDGNSIKVPYTLSENNISKGKFQINNAGQFQVNSVLDYDSSLMASVNFQYSVIIIVSDNGTPSLTTSVSVFVTITPVNEFPPFFTPPTTYTVNERAVMGTVIGTVNATDVDWPFNNVQYSIEGGQGSPPRFYIDPPTGQIILLLPLDFETQSTYQLQIKAVDLNQDLNTANRLTTFQTITVVVTDYNDNPPVCNPSYNEVTIYSTLKAGVSIVALQCTDRDVTSVLSYSIVGGNIHNRFVLNGNNLQSKNTFSYASPGVFDPTNYELLIQVTDGGPPTFSTTATVIVHVVPWFTTAPTTTVTTTKATRHTQIVTLTEYEWIPDPWFVAVLTITGALLLLGLFLLLKTLLSSTGLCGRNTNKMSEPLLENG
ncbi:cadherin-related family member 4-like [Erpetoichthys calabaricus]|uniref:cadherin-related family member 4-like n=1 Tax=Erpetoichthys calabaricus TaxID=27687 RepID=UPI0022341D1D|nr:cadherin-related family member 4-like [Erpetoichthys calabaricus]